MMKRSPQENPRKKQHQNQQKAPQVVLRLQRKNLRLKLKDSCLQEDWKGLKMKKMMNFRNKM